MSDIPSEAIGPKMLALRDDRMRRFAWIMACGEGSAAEAARKAGYSDTGDGAKVRGHYLMHSQKVLDAIQEATGCVLRGLAPLAVRQAKAVLENNNHPAHARMIETVLDRTGHFARSEHTMRVEHSVDVRELEDLARRLAAETGVSAERFLGSNGAPTIEGEALEAEPGEAEPGDDSDNGPEEG
jgi:hypothetical protein